MPTVELHGVARRYDDFVLGPVDLVVPDGAFAVLLGPSGSGKTTLLRMVTGLESPDAGRVLLDGRDVTGVPTERRHLGVVFQEGALFPHLDVGANVAFGVRKRPEAAREALSLVELDGFDRRRVHELSGGERSRVALARALAPVLAEAAPRVLLLDEPFAALDRPLREDLRRRVSKLHRDLGLTTILVTHDREEALLLSDVVVLVREGRIVEVGRTRSVHDAPKTAFAARFLGAFNVLGPDAVRALGGPEVRAGRALALPHDACRARPGGDALVEESGWATRRAVVEVAGEKLVVEDPERGLEAGARVALDVDWTRARDLAAD